MSHLNALLENIIQQHSEHNPLPDDLETYLRDFVPDPKAPIKTYQQIFRIPSDSLEKVYREGYNLYQNMRYEDSTMSFRWLIFFNPFVSKFWIALGASLHMQQDFPSALHAYAVAALLRPKNPYPHYYAYICYSLLQDTENANKARELAIEKSRYHNEYRDLYDELQQTQATHAH